MKSILFPFLIGFPLMFASVFFTPLLLIPIEYWHGLGVGPWWFLLYTASVMGAIPPVLTLIALPFAKRDVQPTVSKDGTWLVRRADLPKWAWFLETVDDRLPGGSEPYVMDMYKRRGFFITSWYWLGFRNQLQALSVYFGINVSAAEVLDSPKWFFKAEGVWRVVIRLGSKFQIRFGWEIVNPIGSHIAVPYFTIKKN
jgi:hypothetical protein